jgi:hypothetical protein
MKKLTIYLITCIILNYSAIAQKLDDFGRIVLNTYLPDNISLPAEAKSQLQTKLNQITSNNGMGGSQINPRFIITANVNIGTKDIISGPPQMVAQNIELVLFTGDAITKTVFSNTTLSLKGVGTNENKALIEAIKSINPKNKELVLFLDEGKNKIINYYNTNCDFIINDAQTLAQQQKYDEAIYKLALVPEVNQECYFKCSDIIKEIFQKKIDDNCKTKLTEAKMIWLKKQDINSAESALSILTDINHQASCFDNVNILVKEINDKLIKDEKAKLELAIKKYNDKIDLEKKRIDAYKEVAVEYAKNQPKTVTYNNIYWR